MGDRALEARGVRDCLRIRTTWQQHGRLVATEAGDDVASGGCHLRQRCELDEYAISGRVTVRVIDALQPVDVGEYERDRLGVMPAFGERFEGGGEDTARCESGQAVDVCLRTEAIDQRELA